MARFSLRTNITDRLLGHSLLMLATIKAIARKSMLAGDTANANTAETLLPIVEEFIESDYLDTTEPQGPLGHEAPVVVKYHYDGPSDEGYLLHIVVPDIGEKEVDLTAGFARAGLPLGGLPKQTPIEQAEELTASATYDFTDFAAESLGHIVIFGCGR